MLARLLLQVPTCATGALPLTAIDVASSLAIRMRTSLSHQCPCMLVASRGAADTMPYITASLDTLTMNTSALTEHCTPF